MTSKVDICNLALSHLGDEATVSNVDPPEGSAQAEHCRMWYPIARDVLLEMHDWRFAVRRKRLVLLDTDSWSWAYAYAAPVDCLVIRSVLVPGAANDGGSERFEVESLGTEVPAILTDAPEATLRFITRVDDPTKYSALFVDALAWLLASYLAGPVLKGDAGNTAATRCFQVFLERFGKAAASDANQRSIDFRDETRSTFIAGR